MRTTQKIYRDTNGEYTLESSHIPTTGTLSLQEDATEVIRIERQNSCITITALTKQQVNIFIDVTEGELVVKANGPVCVDGDIHCDLNISGHSFYFCRPVKVAKLIGVVKKSLSFAKGLQTTSGHIQAKTLNFEGQVDINGGDITSDVICVKAGAVVNVKKTKFTSPKLENHGHLTYESADLAVDEIQQNGRMDLTRVQGQTKFIRQSLANAHSEIRDSLLVGGSFYVDLGTFNCQKTSIQGDDFHAKTGAILSLTELSTVTIKDFFIIDNGAKLATLKARLKAGTFQMEGDWRAAVTFLSADMVTTHHDIVELAQVEIHAKTIHLASPGKFSSVSMKADNCRLLANVDIDDVAITADHVGINADGEKVKMKKLGVTATTLALTGSHATKPLELTDSRLIMKSLTQAGLVECNGGTKIIGSGTAENNHFVKGELRLKESQFITEGQIFSTEGSIVFLVGNSQLQASVVYSKGNLNLADSGLLSRTLLQEHSVISAQHSHIKVDQNIFTEAAGFNLTGGSLLETANMALDGSLSVQQSQTKTGAFLSFHGSMTSAADAKMDLGDTTLLGRAQINHSQVAADHLKIYADVTATGQTDFKVNEEMIVTRGAALSLDHSQAKTKHLEQQGQVTATLSQVVVEEKIDTSYTAAIQLSGANLSAKDLIHRGNLTVHQETVNVNDRPQVVVSTVEVSHQLDTRLGSRVQGDSAKIEASVWKHDGNIAFSQELRATGGSLKVSSYGDITAGKCFLGFDRSVESAGNLSATDLTIQTPVFANPLGKITAGSFNCSSLSYFNAGIISADSYRVSSLTSLNFGLVLPNFSGGTHGVFSTLFAVGKSVIATIFPQHANAINFASSLPNVWSTASALYQTGGHLWEHGVRNMRMHEAIGHFGQFRNAFVFANNMATSYERGMTELNRYPVTWGQVERFWENIGDHQSALFWRLTGALGSNHMDESLFHLNAGAYCSQTATRSNFMHVNYGLEAAVTSQIYTEDLTNAGVQASFFPLYNVETMHNSGAIYAGYQFTLNAQQFLNTGEIHAANMMADIDELDQRNIMHVDGGSLEVAIWRNGPQSDSQLRRSHARGKEFITAGSLAAELASFDYTSFRTTASSAVHTKVVAVKAEEFVHQGHWQHEHGLGITATRVTTSDMSQLIGVKSPEIVETEGSIPTPTHTLSVDAAEINLAGVQRGGDSTQLQGKQLHIASTAQLSIPNAGLKFEKAEIDGTVTLDGFQADIIDTHIGVNAKVNLNSGQLNGATLVSDGQTAFESTVTGMRKTIHFGNSASEDIHDAVFNTDSMQDDSHLNYGGEVFVDANDYQHRGVITSDAGDNLFAVKSQTAVLQGTGTMSAADFNVANFPAASEFIAGRDNYSRYQFGTLGVRTAGDIQFVHPIERDSDLSVTGSSIDFRVAYDRRRNLFLQSTTGDINFRSDVHVENLATLSAGSTHVHGPIQVHGYRTVLMQADGGNIEDHGGVIRGDEYAQLVASGDVRATAAEREYEATHDMRKEYTPAVIQGGTGANHGGRGLYIYAGNQVMVDASNLLSVGDGYVYGEKGCHFLARYHTYVSRDEHKGPKTFMGKVGDLVTGCQYDKHIVATSTDIACSTVAASQGRFIITSHEGDVTSVATNFTSALGTDVYVQGSVRLQSLRTKDKTHTVEHKIWGNNKRNEICHSARPTLFIDNGYTRIHAVTGDVDARGALFLGNGDLSIKAGRNIELGRDVLTHRIKEKQLSFSVSLFGMRAYDSASQNGRVKIWDALVAEDSTLAEIEALRNSGNTAETVVNAVNLGVNLVNTTNSVVRGVTNGTLTEELMSRYGLGGAEGFNPSIDLTVRRTRTDLQFQTLAEGGVQRRSVLLEAGNAVNLHNGVRVHADENMTVIAREINLQAAQLETKRNEIERTATVGVTAKGDVTQVGASYRHDRERSSTVVNAELSAGGHMGLGTVDRVNLRGGNINAGTLSADIGKLNVETVQDEQRSKHKEFSGSSAGQVSVARTTHHEKHTNQVSGIHVAKDLDEKFHVHDANLKGAAITTDGENRMQADHVVAQDLKDVSKTKGGGVSLNVRDLQRLSPDYVAANKTGQAALATVGIRIEHEDFSAQQASVIHGRAGTTPQIAELQGSVHTRDMNGCEVVKDQAFHATVKVPLVNRSDLTMFGQNIQRTRLAHQLTEEKSTIQESLASQDPKPDNPVTVTPPELLPDTQAVKAIEVDRDTSNVLQESLLRIMQQGAGDGFEAIMKPLADYHTGCKVYVTGKAMLLNFAFNLALRSNEPNMCQNAALDTASSFTISFVLGKVISNAAGAAVTWSLLGVDILDRVTYDEQRLQAVASRFTENVQGFKTAQSFFEREGYRQGLVADAEFVRCTTLLHQVAELKRGVEDRVSRGISFVLDLPERVWRSIVPAKQADNSVRQGLFNVKLGTETADLDTSAPMLVH